MESQSTQIQSSIINDNRKQIREFIEQVIKIRKMLMAAELNKKNAMLMGDIIDRLERYMNAYPYTSAVNIAKFFRQNHTDIYKIIPGEGSKCHDAYYEKFNKIYEDCLQILNKDS